MLAPYWREFRRGIYETLYFMQTSDFFNAMYRHIFLKKSSRRDVPTANAEDPRADLKVGPTDDAAPPRPSFFPTPRADPPWHLGAALGMPRE